MEQDAEDILKFIASNGLVVSASKTILPMMNEKELETIRIKVGNATLSKKSGKDSGRKMDDEME